MQRWSRANASITATASLVSLPAPKREASTPCSTVRVAPGSRRSSLSANSVLVICASARSDPLQLPAATQRVGYAPAQILCACFLSRSSPWAISPLDLVALGCGEHRDYERFCHFDRLEMVPHERRVRRWSPWPPNPSGLLRCWRIRQPSPAL